VKLTNNSYYFDYNATTPLANSVKNWIASGDILFANPASFHQLGKKSKALMNQTALFLQQYFHTDKKFEVLFHSGATEGMNTFIRGFAEYWALKKQQIHFFYSGVDHSCTRESGIHLAQTGHQSHCFKVDKDGQFNVDQLIQDVLQAKKSGPVLLNYLWCNNETGVIWPLDLVSKVKKETGCFVHVDAAQVPGKVPHFENLNTDLDVYSFSGHKFGVMKAIGFSFFKEDFPFTPLLLGGGQQHGHRSGTENPWCYTLQLALEELKENINWPEALAARDYFLENFEKYFGTHALIVAKNAKVRNTQTISAIFYNKKADETMTLLDLNSIQVSSGAACSSGIVRPSPVLIHMGHSEDEAKCGIRFSFSPYWNVKLAEDYLSKLKDILGKKFLS